MCEKKIKILAGVAKSDISTSSPETPVMDPLYAKALVLDDGKTKLAIITMDVSAIGANIPAYASKVIEESLGHDSMAFFIQGAAGDIIDIHFKDFSRSRDIKTLGAMLGENILEACKNIQPKEAELDIISETIRVPRRTDIHEKISLLKKEQNELLESLAGTSLNLKSFLSLYKSDVKIDPGMDALNKQNIDKYLKNIYAMEKLARIQDKTATLLKHQRINEDSGEESIDMELQAIKIGDCVITSSPAELLAEIGLNIKRTSPYKHTFVAGYSNGYVHYGAPAADYDKGGYEVTECLLAPEWQEIFETKTLELINKLRN